MCVMEEDSMAISLMYALLDIVPTGDPTIPYHANSPEGEQYLSRSEEQRKEVRQQLYEALYRILENPNLPENNLGNLAIGQALASAISGEPSPGANDPKINVLRDILWKAATDALAFDQTEGGGQLPDVQS
jgi:hypothetical protein